MAGAARKVSLYIDGELWARFKEAVLRKHGTLRRLSSEVEGLLRESLIDEAFGGVGLRPKIPDFPEEVKRGRPRLRGPPSEVLVREMRGGRLAEGLPGQQRDS